LKFKLNIALVFFAFVLAMLLLPLFLKPPIPSGRVDNITSVTRNSLYFDYEITQIPTGVEVTDYIGYSDIEIGVNTDPWNLKFGIIPRGGNFGTREVTLENTEDEPAKVNLYVKGNITPLIVFDEEEFVLAPNEEHTFQVKLMTGTDTALGDYEGQIDIIVKRYRFKLMQNIFGDFE
jgi:hypothetical protein